MNMLFSEREYFSKDAVKFQHRSGSGQDLISGAQICTPPVKCGYEIARYK